MKNISNQLIPAICDALLQSLWLGLVLAAAAGLMVLCTRRATARLRYNLLIAGLGFFTIAIMAIFFRQMISGETAFSFAGIQPEIHPANEGFQRPVSISYYDTITGLLYEHAGSIVLVWSLIVMARTIRLLTGLQSLYFLRRRHISAVGGDWEQRVIQISKQLGIKRLVGIAESGIAQMPMVVGHLKPLILIPAGMITALPPASIEAILVHELAHIFRRDYLVNLLISSLEIVFFFNPAVLWLSALIRAERENCCDDIALAYTDNKKSYINALLACQEYHPGVPVFAMAFGQKDHFLGRVKRMLTNHNSSLNVLERSVLGLTLLMAVLFTTAFSNAKKISKLVGKVTHAAGNVVSPAKVTLPVKSDIAQRPKFKLNDTTNRADTAKIRIYKPDQVGDNTNITIRNGSLQTQLVKIGGVLYQVNRSGHIVSLQVNGNTVASGEQQHYLDIIDQSKPPVAQVAQVSQPAVPAVVARPAPTARDYAGQQQAYAANPYPKDIKPYHDDNNSNKLTAGLIEDGIVQTPKDLRSFKLSDTEFIVNGKKMPDDVYQKYKTLYVPKTNQKGSWSWMFNYDEH